MIYIEDTIIVDWLVRYSFNSLLWKVQEIDMVIQQSKDYENLKFEIYDYYLQKVGLDLDFLVRRRDNVVTPRYLNSCLANNSLRSSLT